MNGKTVALFLLIAGCAFLMDTAEAAEVAEVAEAAEEDLLKICLLSIELGNCDGKLPRWGYNPETRRCELFDYTGCGGNRNNFRTREACELACLIIL